MTTYELKQELLHKRAQLLEQGKSLMSEKKFDEHKSLMEGEVAKLNGQIEAVEKQLAEEGRFATGKGMTPPPAKEDPEAEEKLEELRSSKAYSKAFFQALKSGATVRSGKGREELAPLYKALTISGGTTAGQDGGFLVPIDFDNAIMREAKNYLALADFFNVQTVTTNSGWRVVEDGDPKPLPAVDEMGTIGKNDQPKFRKIEYAVKKYGDRLAISNELLEDEDAGLIQYVAEWFAPKYILTQNSLLLPFLTGLTTTVELTAGSEEKILRKALITKLRTAYSRSAMLLTNQSGYAEMNDWEDKNGRALLVPDPTGAEVMRYRGRQVEFADDTLLTDKELYIGNFKALGTLFNRKGFEMATTNIGGDAWATDSTELRVICRMDAKKVFEDAAFKATFPG